MDSSAIPFETDRSKTLKKLYVSVDEIEPVLDCHYLVQGWLGDGGFSVLYGPSNSGKTFVCIDLALHIASGVPWCGNKTKPRPVVYVASEGGSGVRNRLAAILDGKPTLAAQAGFHLLPTHLDLFAGEDSNALCNSLPVTQPALIVIDTMARSMGAGDENSAKDVAQFVASIDLIRRRTGAHVLVVHHSGKSNDQSARGSSALRAAIDTEIKVSRGKISCTKQRDMETPRALQFELETIELGEDQNGDLVKSAIVIATKSSTKALKPLSPSEEKALRALSEALELKGRKCAGENFPTRQAVVSLKEWKAQCSVVGLTKSDANKEAQRKSFSRAQKSLLDRELIYISEGFVWLVSRDE